MQKQTNPINETSDDARALARQLIRTARFAAISVLQDDGSPLVTRVLLATDGSGNPTILISELSEHTKAITSDNRVSLLLGEPKKGDPVAHPRISVQGEAIIIPRESAQYRNLRARFVAKHPKSELYIGFADFQIFKINANSANLNGGFGKAFHLQPSDLLSKDTAISEMEQDTLDLINKQHSDIAAIHVKDQQTRWRIISIDCDGFELANGDNIIRKEFKTPMCEVNKPADIITFLTNKENLK